MSLPLLWITDGTTTVNLHNGGKAGFSLQGWEPARPALKGGGIWADSPLADGRRLVDYHYENVTDTFTIAVKHNSQDLLIRDCQNADRLLTKALDYGKSNWQTEPVYLMARSPDETNTRYALIRSYHRPNDKNPYAEPFNTQFCHSTMADLTLAIEHDIWQSTIPGEGTCQDIAGYQTTGMEEGEFYPTQTDDDAFGYAAYFDTAATSFLFGSNINSGFRFRSVAIPQGATIEEARVTFEAFKGNFAEADTWIYGQSSATPAAFLNWAGYAARVETTAHVDWELASCSAGVLYTSPDIKDVVQEIVDLPGWTGAGGGDDLALLLKGKGVSSNYYEWYTWEAFNAGLAACPTLYVRWNLGDVRGYERLCEIESDIFEPIASLDDVYTDSGAGGSLTDGVTLLMGRDAAGDSLDTGVRFRNIAIPRNATIIDAFVELQCTVGVATVDVNLALFGEEGAAPAIFSNYADFVGRARTTESTEWHLVPFWGTGFVYRSPDVGPILQHLVDLAAWESGNDAVIFIEDDASTNNATRNADSVTGAYNAPRLIVRWTAEDAPPGFSSQVPLIANKHNRAQITHAFAYDLSLTTFSANLVGASPPTAKLFSDPLQTGDILYIGIESTAVQEGPFCSVVFDIGNPVGYPGAIPTVAWAYCNNAVGPAFAALTVTDNTNGFKSTGIRSVHWVQPADWVGLGVINGITAWWVKATFTIAGNGTPPTQERRDIFSILWPFIEAEDIPGDIRALMCLSGQNVSGASIDVLKLRGMVMGLRSLSRGEDFSAVLNGSDEQHQAGVTCSVTAPMTFSDPEPDSPCGAVLLYTGPGAPATMAQRALWTIDETASQYTGRFRAFLRCKQLSGVLADLLCRLSFRYGATDENPRYTDAKAVPIHGISAIDFGMIDLGPRSFGAQPPDDILIGLEVQAVTASINAWFYDLWLIPVDEWAAEVYHPNETAAFYGISGDDAVVVDSVRNPKVSLRAYSRTDLYTDDIQTVWRVISAGPAILQANAGQRLWVFQYRHNASASTLNNHEFEICANADVQIAARYQSMRGER